MDSEDFLRESVSNIEDRLLGITYLIDSVFGTARWVELLSEEGLKINLSPLPFVSNNDENQFVVTWRGIYGDIPTYSGSKFVKGKIEALQLALNLAYEWSVLKESKYKNYKSTTP